MKNKFMLALSSMFLASGLMSCNMAPEHHEEPPVEPIDVYYKVSFDYNLPEGETGYENFDVTVKENDLVAEVVEPVLENYTFTGWTKEGVLYDFMAPVTEDFTLVGTWLAKEPEKEQALLPTKDIVTFFEEAGLDVVIPLYTAASMDVEYEVDTSYEGYFDVYVVNTTSEELVAYKEALKEEGWVVVSADEETSEDFRLRYGETSAYVDLLDYTSYADEETPAYNLLSFYIHEDTPIEYTAASAIDAVADLLNEMLTSPISAKHTDEGDYIVLNFGDGLSAAQLKYYSDNFFVPEGFATPMEAWGTDSFDDGTPVEYIDYVCGNVALEYLVYSVEEPEEHKGLYYQVVAFELAE